MPQDRADDFSGLKKVVEAREREELWQILRGKVLRRTKSNVGGGVSGVISTTQKKEGLFLFNDGTFRFETTEFISVSSGGWSMPSQEKSSFTGEWTVETVDGANTLTLRQEGSVVQRWRARDGGQSVQYLNGELWNRYAIKQ